MSSDPELFFSDDSYDCFLGLLATGMFDLAEEVLESIQTDYGASVRRIAGNQLRISRLLEPYLHGRIFHNPPNPLLLDRLVGSVKDRYQSLFKPGSDSEQEDTGQAMEVDAQETQERHSVTVDQSVEMHTVFGSYILALWEGTDPPALPFRPDVSQFIESAVQHWNQYFWNGNRPPIISGGHIIALLGALLTRGIGQTVSLQDLEAETHCSSSQFNAAIQELGKGVLVRRLPWMLQKDKMSCSLMMKTPHANSLPSPVMPTDDQF